MKHPNWTSELAVRVAAIEAERESPARTLLGTIPCTESVTTREGRRKVHAPCAERMSVYANDQRARGWFRAECPGGHWADLAPSWADRVEPNDGGLP